MFYIIMTILIPNECIEFFVVVGLECRMAGKLKDTDRQTERQECR